jgi:hypothetical protein
LAHRIKRPKPTPELMATGATCLQLGISQDCLKKFRQSGQLRQGIHYVTIPGSPKILWRIDLVRDWLANGESPAHQRAIEKYLASLPSSDEYKLHRTGGTDS